MSKHVVKPEGRYEEDVARLQLSLIPLSCKKPSEVVFKIYLNGHVVFYLGNIVVSGLSMSITLDLSPVRYMLSTWSGGQRTALLCPITWQ